MKKLVLSLILFTVFVLAAIGSTAWERRDWPGVGGSEENLPNPSAWQVFYSNGDGTITEITLGANGTYLKSQGAATAPTWAAPAGAGDVTGVGDCADGDCLDGSADGGTSIAIYDGDSNKVTISSGNLAGDITMVLPTDDGDNNEVLTTNGAGTLSWSAAGSGDVTGAGDCASGDCLDGSADGGTYVRIYDGDSHYLELNPGDLSANRAIAFRDAAGTAIISGDTFTGDVTATLDTDGSTVLTVVDDSHAHIFSDIDAFTEANLYTILSDVTLFLEDLVDDTTPQLGGDLDLNQKSVVYDPTPDSDHTWNGHEFTATSGMALTQFDVCILQADGKFDQADADAEGTTKGMCVMASEAFTGDTDTGVAILPGTFVRDDTWDYTIGAVLYVDTTPGPPTETAPSGSGDFVRVVGYAYTADIIYFDPSGTWVEIS